MINTMLAATLLVSTSASVTPRTVWVDVNGDARDDLVRYVSGGAMQLLINEGNGEFRSAPSAWTRGGATAVEAVDFDGDGIKEIVVARMDGTRIVEVIGGQPKVRQELPGGTHLETLDFDQDARMDLVIDARVFRQKASGLLFEVDLPPLPGAGAVAMTDEGPRGGQTPDNGGPLSAIDEGGHRQDSRFAYIDDALPHVDPPRSESFPVEAVCVVDQADPNNCLEASSDPTPGTLLANGPQLNVLSGFVGVNRSSQVTSAEAFGVNTISSVGYGGVYINSTGALGKPFYGYATNGTAKAWHYFDGLTGDWRLYNNGDRLTVDRTGNVGVGTTSPFSKLSLGTTLGNTTLALYETSESYAYGFGVSAGRMNLNIAHAGARFAFHDAPGGNEIMTIQGSGRVGIGVVNPAAELDVNGTARAKVVEVTGADLAEKFEVSGDALPGMVVAIDPDREGALRVSDQAYDPCVAGVISGAGGLPAGTIMGNLPGAEDAHPVALSGRVWVLCDAADHPIQPGDLLTTADTPGHAMKATDPVRARGASIGKAMTTLESGKGLVLALVSLK